jgi:hypothetical protein
MKTKMSLTRLVLSALLLCLTVTPVSAQVTPNGGTPIEAIFEIHHESTDESFVIFGDDISLGGLLPTKVDYQKDYSKLQGQTFDILETQKHGGIDYNSFMEINGEDKLVAKGTVTVNEVAPLDGLPHANVKGTYQVEFKDGGSSQGDFQLVASVKDYSLNTLGMLLMGLSIISVWALAIFCYKKLLFDSPD